jgi:carboxymethylenebutenolidase
MPAARLLWRPGPEHFTGHGEKRQAACKAAGKTCEVKVYTDAPHGFNADYRPSYRPDDAKDGWARILAWFKEHGVG